MNGLKPKDFIIINENQFYGSERDKLVSVLAKKLLQQEPNSVKLTEAQFKRFLKCMEVVPLETSGELAERKSRHIAQRGIFLNTVFDRFVLTERKLLILAASANTLLWSEDQLLTLQKVLQHPKATDRVKTSLFVTLGDVPHCQEVLAHYATGILRAAMRLAVAHRVEGEAFLTVFQHLKKFDVDLAELLTTLLNDSESVEDCYDAPSDEQPAIILTHLKEKVEVAKVTLAQ